MRIGHGIDVHRLTEGRPLIIGGVNIPFEKGLAGHSDADVLLHAVMDALLGAAALGDIGKHFPDTDPSFKGADSMELLKRVGRIIDNSGYEIVNIDSTIRAQRPKMAMHIDNMRSNIASALCIDSSQVSVKATTEEHLGFTGREEGIAAEAVCLIKKKKDKAEKKSEKKKGKKSDKKSDKKSEKKSDKKSAGEKSSDTKGKIEL